MTPPTGCRLKCQLICFIFLIPLSSAQFYDNSADLVNNKYQPPQFVDPIRRALGLWSRLLNRMSQASDPTDDELHLRVGEDGAKSAFEDLELPNLFPNLNQRRDKNARLPPIQPGFSLTGSNGIISEERLNQLLPRTREEQTKERIETTTSKSKHDDNSESLPEHDKKIHSTTPKPAKSLKGPTKSTKKPQKVDESNNNKSPSKSRHQVISSKSIKITNKEEASPPKSTKSSKPEEIQQKRAKKPQKVSSPQNDDASNSREDPNTSSAEAESMEREVKRKRGRFVSSSENDSRSESSEEGKKPIEDKKIQKTKVRGVLRVTAVNDSPPPSTTQRVTTPTTEPTTKIQKPTTLKTKKPLKTTTPPIETETEFLLLTGDAITSEFQSSGTEPEDATENDNVEEVTTTEVPKTTTTTQKPTTTIKPTRTSTTIKPTTTTRKPTTISTTLATTTKKPLKWEKQRIRKPFSEEESEEGIPEAEEAEFQTDDQPMTTTIVAEHSSLEADQQQLKSTEASLEEESHENERKLEKMMTPVSSIIDGIGPLILPLLGYSRQTVAGILNPAAAVASAPSARVAGTRTFRPQQAPSNAQIVRALQRQPLDTLTPFQQVVAPIQQRQGNMAFKQANGPRKAYGNGQAHVKNHIVEPVEITPAEYFTQNKQSPDTTFPAPSNNQAVDPSLQDTGFARVVNTDASNGGFGQQQQQQSLPESAASVLNGIDQATLLEVYKQILAKRGLRGNSLRGVNEDQLEQFARLAVKIPPKQQTPQVSINAASEKAKPEIRRQPSEDDPGYQMGRSNVVSSFYEDSGLMVGTQPGPQIPPPMEAPSSPNSVQSSGGFGGGRRPDSSFEQASLATVDDGRSFLI